MVRIINHHAMMIYDIILFCIMSNRITGAYLKNYKVFSKHPYYSYLGKYDVEFIRKT